MPVLLGGYTVYFMTEVKIKKVDEELQIVYAEVYVPNIPDSQNDFMTVDTIRNMAHNFLLKAETTSIDVEHSGDKVPAGVVESFIARKNDPDFIENSWVTGVKIFDDVIWGQIKKGEINGFSLDGIGKGEDVELVVEIPEFVTGETDVVDGHAHVFKVEFDEDGTFLGGRTEDDTDHDHVILKGTITETTNEHAHRFSFVEMYA